MRKITSLLMLLCVFAVAAWAQETVQITSLADIDPNKAYVIYSNESAWRTNDEGTGLTTTGKKVEWEKTDTKNQFAFLKHNEDWYVYSISANRFVAFDLPNLTATSTSSADAIEFVNCTGASYAGRARIRFKYNTSKNIDFSGDRASILLSSWALEDEGTAFYIEEVGDINLDHFVDVTYNYKVSDNTMRSETIKQFVNTPYSAPEIDFVKVSYSNTDVVSSTNNVIDVNCTYNTPFKVSEDYDNAIWHYMSIHGTDPNYLYYHKDSTVLDASKKVYDEDNPDAYSWAFIGNPFDGFKIINKEAGKDMILSSTKPTKDETYPYMIATADVTGNQVWDIYESTYGINGFFWAYDGTTDRLNRQSKLGGVKVCYWLGGADDGSTFMVQEIIDITKFGTLLESPATMVNGKYYRIQSSTRKSFTGINGYTFNMQNQPGDLDNPGQIWKYVVDGEAAYLQNAYAGLYPQAVPTGGANTTKIGTEKSKAFTYNLNNESDKFVWNIFFGGAQVNIEPNGNVNQWNGDNAHHYIYEVDATDEDIADLCENWYVANPSDYTTTVKASDYAKIDIDEKATVVISPSEFAAPSVINSTIDNLDAAISEATSVLEGDELTIENIQSQFVAILNVSKYVSDLNAYKNAVTSYGELLSIAYTPKAEWGTIILPINWSNPEGWTRYSCAETEGNVLTLANFTAGTTKNTPMIIHFEESAIGKTYQLIGYSKGAGTENVTAGLLTGVLEDDTNVPAGSYVLSDYNDQIGFYPVATGATYPATKYMCYLTLPAASARYAALFFEGGETAIESIQGVENANAVVYDLAGRRVQGAQKGLYIVNGKKVVK